VDRPRRAAYDLLRTVADDGAYANLALPDLLSRHGLSERDAAFTTELGFGALRLRGRYDAIIALCASRPLDRIDPRVLDALRLGAHQILAMNVPDYAAVSSSADLARRLGPGAAGFVNAVLRRLAATPQQEWLDAIPPPAPDDPLGHQCAAASHPRWIGSALADALALADAGGELAELLAADNDAAPVSLVARPGRISPTELADATGGTPGRWSPWAVGVSGDPGRFTAVRDGRAGVQDEGSQLMVLALSRAEVDCGDTSWLDMCAGPGGKAAVLAALARQQGAELTAVELHPHRARLVARTAGSEELRLVVGDAREAPLSGGYSRILLDAPCTGLGAIRRRPDLRWRRTPADLPALRGLQRDLLQRALALTAVGGVVAYVTCSPHVAESDDIVAEATRHAAVEQVDARGLLPEVPGTGPGPAVRLWPHRHDTDGMYLALLRRVA
jgi:16S rRNA (cytosine967-C5)-methyltransferase